MLAQRQKARAFWSLRPNRKSPVFSRRPPIALAMRQPLGAWQNICCQCNREIVGYRIGAVNRFVAFAARTAYSNCAVSDSVIVTGTYGL
jgi:hypothetical protein